MIDPESLMDKDDCKRCTKFEKLFFWLQEKLVDLQGFIDDYKKYMDHMYSAQHESDKELKWLYKEYYIPPSNDWDCTSNKPRLVNALKMKLKEQFKKIAEIVNKLIERVS